MNNSQSITGKTNIRPMSHTDKIAVCVFWAVVILVAVLFGIIVVVML